MNMKKIISLLLVLVLALSFTSFAEGNGDKEVGLELSLGGAYRGEDSEPTHLTVCNSTKVNGAFFSRQFGNNTSDIDVRAMLHGYNPIVWDTQLTFKNKHNPTWPDTPMGAGINLNEGYCFD